MRTTEGGSRTRCGKTTGRGTATTEHRTSYDGSGIFPPLSKMWKNGPAVQGTAGRRERRGAAADLPSSPSPCGPPSQPSDPTPDLAPTGIRRSASPCLHSRRTACAAGWHCRRADPAALPLSQVPALAKGTCHLPRPPGNVANWTLSQKGRCCGAGQGPIGGAVCETCRRNANHEAISCQAVGEHLWLRTSQTAPRITLSRYWPVSYRLPTAPRQCGKLVRRGPASIPIEPGWSGFPFRPYRLTFLSTAIVGVQYKRAAIHRAPLREWRTADRRIPHDSPFAAGPERRSATMGLGRRDGPADILWRLFTYGGVAGARSRRQTASPGRAES
jgi:hypothetical protein